MQTQIENEFKKSSSDALAAAAAAAAAKTKVSSKRKEKEKDIATSKVVKSMLSVIDYPEADFVEKYKSNTLNYDDIHFPFSIKNNRNTTEVELCIMQEFLLRFYDKEQEENKRWFFTPVEVLINSI